MSVVRQNTNNGHATIITWLCSSDMVKLYCPVWTPFVQDTEVAPAPAG